MAGVSFVVGLKVSRAQPRPGTGYRVGFGRRPRPRAGRVRERHPARVGVSLVRRGRLDAAALRRKSRGVARNIADIRRDYARASLNEDAVDASPIVQFQRWLDEALSSELPEPTAMSLSTVDDAGRPSSRMVLLKGVDERGFVFYTNYESRKGRELAAHPVAALLFFWAELERQVRVEGTVERVAPEESDAYFASRPLTHRIGAWASPQSQVITKRALELRIAKATLAHGIAPSRPPHWGGFRLTPDRVELWQGRPSRLHDRLRYTLEGGVWSRARLAP